MENKRFTTKIDDEYIVGVSVGEGGWTDVAEEKQYEANQKLGKIEDIFELIEEMYKKPVCYKIDNGEDCSDDYTDSTILYNPKTNEIEIYEYDFIAKYKVEEYGKTWWFKKDRGE